jgi:hypothetical protein
MGDLPWQTPTVEMSVTYMDGEMVHARKYLIVEVIWPFRKLV